jgi:hypothetical protein
MGLLLATIKMYGVSANLNCEMKLHLPKLIFSIKADHGGTDRCSASGTSDSAGSNAGNHNVNRADVIVVRNEVVIMPPGRDT